MKNGKGIMIYFDTGDIYEGEWEGDKKNGKGRQFYNQNQSWYVGDFVDDKKQGKGRMYDIETPDEIYEGEFSSDKKNGEGVLIMKNKDGLLIKVNQGIH